MPVLALDFKKIAVPVLIQTGVQILNKKHDSTVKAPANFNPRDVWVKTSRDRKVNLPAGDYFVRLKPRKDVRLQPQTTPWFRVSKHTIARVIVENSGVRRIEFRIDRIRKYSYDRGILFAQAAQKLPVQTYPVPANDNLPARLLVPSEAEVAGELVAAEAITLDGLVVLVAANPIGALIITAVIVTEVYILPTLAVTETNAEANPVQQPKTQPRQNPREQTSPDQCWDEEFPAISSGKRPSQAPKDRREEIAWREKTGSQGQIIDRFPADAKRLAAAYGGSAVDWVRKAYLPREFGLPEVHWLENIETRQKVEFIFRDPCHIPPKDCEEMGSANALTGKTTRFNGKNPGPLAYSGVNEAKNFVNSSYTKVITDKWVRLYRVWGGGANKAGQYGGFWTRMPISYEQLKNPAFVQKLRDMFALPSDWNAITDITVREFKPGTPMYVGNAAKQPKFPQYKGGGEQVFLDGAARESFASIGCPEK